MRSIFSKGVLIALLAALSVGCAPQEKEHQEQFVVEQDFLPYVQNFELTASLEGQDIKITDLIISFGPTSNLSETGVCEITTNETPKITINKTIWNMLSELDRQEVIFHELGHCTLRRVHVSDMMPEQAFIPQSVMYPYRISGNIYNNYMDHYHNELFSKRNEF